MFTDEFKVKVRESNEKGKKTDMDRKDKSNSEGKKDRRGEVKNKREMDRKDNSNSEGQKYRSRGEVKNN